MKGGRLINKGFKGMVYEINDLINDLKSINEITLVGINDKSNFIKNKVFKDDIISIINILSIKNYGDNLLVKKFINSNFFIGDTKDNFYNELNGYKKLISIFGNKINKYTTIKEGFIFKNRKIYAIFFNDNFYIFLEKCQKTIDNIKFTQKTFNKFSFQILHILNILNKNKYIHNDIKPSNIIICNNDFKIIDWELSFSFSKQSKGFYLNKNGNFTYNHPIKFYTSGIPLLIYKLFYNFEFIFHKDLQHLNSPHIIHKLIDDTFYTLNNNRLFYLKYSDYFAFALVHIYIAEKNNLNILPNIINPILNKFNIKFNLSKKKI